MTKKIKHKSTNYICAEADSFHTAVWTMQELLDTAKLIRLQQWAE